MTGPLGSRVYDRDPGEGGLVQIFFDDRAYDCASGETVLEALRRQNVALSFSCEKGVCQSCLTGFRAGEVPSKAQEGLRDTLREQGYFLLCMCRPTTALKICRPDDTAAYVPARVLAVEPLADSIRRVFLEPSEALRYRAGQFVNLRRKDGLARPYSLATVPGQEPYPGVDVKLMPGGRMSSWVFDGLMPGVTLYIQGPSGTGYYVPGRADQSILMVGNGSGLGALAAIARDALAQGHRGPIDLYHGTRHPAGLYLRDELSYLAKTAANFRYHPCVSGEEVGEGQRPARADDAALADHPDLTGRRIFLCGYAPMVHAAKKAAYLAGADLADIYADPYELQELRGDRAA